VPPASTIESAFVILDRASPAIRGIKREVKDLRQEAEKAGVALDHIAEPREITELRALAEQTQSLAHGVRDVKDTLGGPSGANAALTRFGERVRTVGRDVDQLRVKVDRLTGSMDRLRAMDVRPRVNIDGIVEARAQLAALRSELRSFGRQSPTARVGVSGGGFAGAAGGLAGGGGGGGGGLRSVGLGSFNLSGGAGLGLLAAGLPIAQSLGGAAGAVGASLGGAALGAGTIGYAAGLPTAAAGVGALAAVVKPAQQGLQNLTKTQTAYNQAVQDYGRRSLEAARARRELNQAEAAAPAGSMPLLRQQAGLRADWARLTRPGQTALTGAATTILGQVRGAAPTLAADTTTVARATGTAGVRFGAFATDPQQMLVMRLLTTEFSRDLPAVERTAEHLVTTFGNVSRAALPFLHEGTQFVDHWTAGWAHSTADIRQTRDTMRPWVDDLRTASHLAGDTFKFVRDLFTPGEAQGRGMLQDLDSTIQRWDQFAQRNPDALRQFFRDGVRDTERLAHFLGIAVGDLHRMATAVEPLVGHFADLASLFGGTGLLLPTALRIGAGRMLNRDGQGGGGGGGGGGGMLPIFAGGRGGGAASAVTTAEIAGTGYLAARGLGRLGLSGYGALATPETFAARYGGIAGARYAMPELIAQRSYGLSRFGTGALRAGGAAARFAAPLALVAGGLGAAETPGPWYSRLTGGLHAATLGVVPVETGGSQQRATGAAQARAALQHLPVSMDPNVIRGNIAHIQQQLGVQRGRLDDAVSGALEQPITSLFGGKKRPVRGEVQGQIAQLQQALQAQNAVLKDGLRQRNVILDEQSREHGLNLSDSLQQAFGIETRHGKTPADALGDVLDQSLIKLRRMRPAGAKVLGDNMLAWADEMASKNPKLKGVVEDFTSSVERKFSRLGQHVKVVDGNILTGATTEWQQIGKALSDPAEQAREKVSAAFTAIQRQAIGSLEAMGYSARDARSILRSSETISRLSGGRVSGASAVGAARGLNAAGQRYAAQGRAARSGDGPGLDVQSQHLAFAARNTGASDLMGANPNLEPYAQLGRTDGLTVSSGLRPGAITVSGNTSYHATGHAIDMSGAAQNMRRFALQMASEYGSGLEELIYSPLGWGIKNGRRVPNSVFGPAVIAEHYNHVHVADVDPRGGVGGIPFSPDTLGPGLMQIALNAPKSRLGGAPGALADAAGAMYAAGLSGRLNDMLGGGGLPGGAAPALSGAGSYGLGQLAQLWIAAGGSPGIATLMAHVAIAESGGQPGVRNPSGATGLWQILGSMVPGNLTDPMVNARNAVAKYRAQGLGAWAASRPAWGQFAGDGLGGRPMLRGGSRVRIAGRGGGGGGGRSAVIHFAPQVNVGMGRSAIRTEFSKLADQVYNLIVSGPEETD
jgi:hypothetical protein